MKRSPLVRRDTRNVSIVGTVVPTERDDMSPLMKGDLWMHPKIGKPYTWDGNFWVPVQRLEEGS